MPGFSRDFSPPFVSATREALQKLGDWNLAATFQLVGDATRPGRKGQGWGEWEASVEDVARCVYLPPAKAEESLLRLQELEWIRIRHICDGVSAYSIAWAEGEAPEYEEPAPIARRGPVVRKCAVYRFFDADGRLLYVGKAVDPEWREKGHRRRVWWRDVARKSVEWFDSEDAALAAEDLAIRDESPLYNRIRTNRVRAELA